MVELRKSERAGELRLVESDDLICELEDYPPTLDCDFVGAVCVDVHEFLFLRWKKKTLVFEFIVFEPEEYAGIRLLMFVRLGNWKKRPPISSKLAKVAQVAGCKRKFTKSAFLNKAFRCRLTKTTRGDAPYTVIDMITEKLTGKAINS